MLARLFGSPPSSIPGYPERRRVVVNTTDDPNAAIRGVRWEARREYLILKGAELLTVGQKATPMDGEILIYREKVAWIQVLSTGERE